MNIAVVVAHPDDAEYMMGGTIIKYIGSGHKVTVIICTNGNAGPPIMSKEEIAKVRKNEAIEGAKIMGAEVIQFDYNDEFLPDNEQSRLAILNALRKADSQVVFTHHPDDLTNADHRVVSNIATDLSYMQMMKNIKTDQKETGSYAALYYIDIPAGVGFEPLEYVDITEVFEIKKEALLKHKSQMDWMKQLKTGGDFVKNMETQAAFRGLQHQCTYAEAFIGMNKYPRAIPESLLP